MDRKTMKQSAAPGVSLRQLEIASTAMAVAALWADLSDENGDPMDEYSVADIGGSTMRNFKDELREFCIKNPADVSAYIAKMGCEGLGHDFWLTKQGHGVGFADRGLGKLGERLHEAAQDFSEQYLYVGDDGKVHAN